MSRNHLKPGYKFEHDGKDYIVTNIHVPGTFCMYAVCVTDGTGLTIRTNKDMMAGKKPYIVSRIG
jgi:S-adenosylmethionine:tRNA-ribosyltransferase-isomerase (queuine synthetase)